MKKRYSILAFLLTFIGGCGVGINILLSEILYSKIDSFNKTPIGYQWMMYISILVVLLGIILSVAFRNKTNTKEIERKIEIPFMFVGLVLILFIPLLRNESYFKDVLICIGGFLFFVGLSCFISTEIGLHRNGKSN